MRDHGLPPGEVDLPLGEKISAGMFGALWIILFWLLVLWAALGLAGCAGIPIGVLYGLEAAASVATIADKVVGIDVSLTQTTPGKAKMVPAQ